MKDIEHKRRNNHSSEESENKYLQEVDKAKTKGRVALGAGSATLGGLLLKKEVDKGNLTGRELLYHNTKKENVKSILKNGVRASFSGDPENITRKSGTADAIKYYLNQDLPKYTYYGKQSLE